MPALFAIKNLNIAASIKDIDGKKGIVTGYFSHFNNLDSDGDIIRPGAFSKTITLHGPTSSQPRIKHLFNHNPAQPLGKLVDLKEDNTGLYYESQTGTHTLGQDFIKMIESGLITEHSIGFQTIESKKAAGSKENEITEIKLWEGSSLSAWGANGLTPITGIKGYGEDYVNALILRQKNIESFCTNSNASDEIIQTLLIECKQISQILINTLQSQATKAETQSTLPDEEIISAIRSAFKPIHSILN